MNPEFERAVMRRHAQDVKRDRIERQKAERAHWGNLARARKKARHKRAEIMREARPAVTSIRRRAVLAMYLEEVPIAMIAAAFGVSSARISELLDEAASEAGIWRLILPQRTRHRRWSLRMLHYLSAITRGSEGD